MTTTTETMTLRAPLWTADEIALTWLAPKDGEWLVRFDAETGVVLVSGYGTEWAMTVMATSRYPTLIGGVMLAKADGTFAQHWVEADDENRFRQEMTALLTALCAGRTPHR